MATMTKRRMANYASLNDAVIGRLGISRDDFDALLRIQQTLHSWGERECNEDIETREDGSTWTRYPNARGDMMGPFRIANRERGALKRLAAIMARYPTLAAYHQTDPRGCALYVYPRAKLLDGMEIDSCYSSVGVALCY